MEKIILENGIDIPVMFLGPGEVGYVPRRANTKNRIKRGLEKIKKKTIGEYCYTNAIANALDLGIQGIDFSATYGTGQLISKAIKKSNVDRNDLFITTRVSNKAQFKGSEYIEEEYKQQLKGFDVEYFDMLMFHWPVTGCFEETWMAMTKLQEQGLCRMLGVANCHEHHLNRIYEISGIYPTINQIEVHPLFTQNLLRDYCKEHNIIVQSYSPTARQDDRLMNPPLLNDMAKKYKKSRTQIILRWHIQHGMIPVIRSLNKEHQKSNVEIFDFIIDEEDMKKIDSLNLNSRLRYDPDNCDFTAL